MGPLVERKAFSGRLLRERSWESGMLREGGWGGTGDRKGSSKKNVVKGSLEELGLLRMKEHLGDAKLLSQMCLERTLPLAWVQWSLRGSCQGP